jgi:hypothetical protein
MDLNTTLRKSYDTEMLILRTLFALDPDTNMPISTNYVVTTDGIGGLVWLNPFTNLSTAGTGIGYLPSTINELRSNVSSMSTMVSSLQIGLSSLSTVIGNAFIASGVYSPELTSSITGLATVGYVSSQHLASTTQGLGTLGYVSTLDLVSTVNWFLDPAQYVSTGALLSTTAGVLPVPQLVSTVAGLGGAGYISTSGLVSTVQGISTTMFSTLTSTILSQVITPLQLVSTVSSLGTIGYVSSSQLVSTVNWLLDPSRYVSTGALVSTVNGISTNIRTTFYIDNGGTFNIYGGTTIVSSATSVVFLSTFMQSSITYMGDNGTITAVRYPDATLGNHMFFSSARLRFDMFSSYILNTSRINLEILPTFVFSRLNSGATSYSLINMSSMIAYGNSYLTPVASSWVYAGTQTSGFGNLFQQPIQFQIPGSLIQNNYSSNYFLVHNLVSSITSNTAPGFVNGTVELQFASTNSLFLSIQNLP